MPSAKKQKTDTLDTKTPDVSNDSNPPATTNTKSDTKQNVTTEKEADTDLEEHLICGICQSLFHKCISLIPCMHNFCAYCIGEWSERSNQCPQVCSFTLQLLHIIYTYLVPKSSKRRFEKSHHQQRSRRLSHYSSFTSTTTG